MQKHSYFRLFSLFLLAFLFVLSSCGAEKGSEKDKSDQDKPNTEESDPRESDEGTDAAPEGAVSVSVLNKKNTWKGKIDDKYPVTVTLGLFQGIAYGELVYDKVGKPITLIGEEAVPGDYTIKEFKDDGTITGVWDVKIDNDEMKGEWRNPNDWESMPVSLSNTAIEDLKDHRVAESIVGTYHYAYGDSGAIGTLKVLSTDGPVVKWEIDCNIGPPAYNMAVMEDMTSDRSEGPVGYSSSDEWGECAFEIEFFMGFAIVNYIDNKAECGFGHNAFVDGIFLRVPSK